uniref:Putative secreted protein n=1 Tax=Rhipicephalus microplus TaxID=6941 RepID=A0A6G5A250_RHIMP
MVPTARLLLIYFVITNISLYRGLSAYRSFNCRKNLLYQPNKSTKRLSVMCEANIVRLSLSHGNAIECHHLSFVKLL